ncbi:hypothetical protein BDA96_10G162700 [Sorghum bicolor]|jgi:hypothetical protein|uniref:DUF1618 domain-containing protein n=1 Tax=Sorghum bicolor TaxID=4558 RepID=A0A921Q3I8_SORBI|nr:uncharacterized protein LOC8072849 [Sorghum bicolor]KAG0514118.1 hypothetical protein BDA96_10G162700 [Sorghum bicolor]|eukprot:XP_002438304.1 uncharacterized protein LOC8072849 [Sorghum bicolor]
MASSSSSSSPAPLWVALGRVTLVQHDSIKDPGDVSLKLALPPRASTLTVPMSVHPKPDYDDTDRHPYVIAAADAGLLLHVSHWPFVGFDLDRDPPGIVLVARDFLRGAGPGEAIAASVVRIPDRDRRQCQAGISSIKNTGLVSLPGSGGADYAVAELYISASDEDDDDGDDDDRATLLFFRSRADSWVQKDLRCPSMSGRRWMWSSHDVIGHDGKLWWVNLVWGLLGCDPFADEPVLHHVPLQETYPIGHTAEVLQDIERRRMVRVSQGKLRFVELACHKEEEEEEETLLVVWTLVFGRGTFTRWQHHRVARLASIWASDSYRATGLPAQVPALALLHPSNPDVVYLYLEQYLFGVNVAQSMVVDFVRRPCKLVEVVAGHKRPPPVSWRHFLAWELPCSLAGGKT